jgi:hypothetical protein
MDESTTVVVDHEYMRRRLLRLPPDVAYGFLPLHVEVMIIHFSLHELPERGCMLTHRLQHIDFRQARQLKVIGAEAIQDCNSLLSVNLVGTITEVIKTSAFSSCLGLREVVFNRELRVIRGM